MRETVAPGQTGKPLMDNRNRDNWDSAEAYRTLFRHSADAMFLSDFAGNILFINQEAVSLFGYDSIAELENKSSFEFIAPHENDAWKQHLQQIKKTTEPFTSVLTAIQKRGKSLMVEMHSAVVEMENGQPAILSLAWDVTERIKAQESLLVERDFAESLIQTAQVIILVLDPKGRIVRFNPYMEQITDYQVDEVKGRDWFEAFLPQNSRDQIRVLFSRALNDLPTENFITAILTKSGLERLIEWNARALLDREGTLFGLLAVGQDVTDRVKAEEEKAKLGEQLRQAQKMESIGRLAGGIAHDFNNLLTPILGYTEALLEELPAEDPHHGDLLEIMEAANQARDLTRQLLAFGRKQVLELKTIGLNTVISGMEKMLRRLIGEDIEVHIMLEPALGSIKADRSQIQQIILNMAINARDSMPNGGKLTVETTNTVLDSETTRSHPHVRPGAYVMLSVSDSGIGMDKETLNKIFEPFFTTKDQGTGTGLGLAMVYGIVKQHGGHIWVYSEPNRGSTFKVYLPLSDEDVDFEEGHYYSLQTPRARQGEVVLLVEDEPSVLGLATKLLKKQGYQVIEARTAKDAIQIADAHGSNIHLLLTDIIMPEMNGRDLYRHLAEGNPSMKALFMSGYTGNVIAQHGILEHGIHFLQKPFSILSLSQKVREALDA